MEKYLDRGAKIVNNPHFENGLFKIMTKDFVGMTPCEKIAVSILKKPSQNEITTSESVDNIGGYYQQLLKRRRISVDQYNQYIDCSFCIATTNTVERLFSTCKHVPDSVMSFDMFILCRVRWIDRQTGTCFGQRLVQCRAAPQ